ncbi:dipicolinate synthase subunit DpsA [Heliobacterium gestii]|uniref:Dipicolinate synthase subunit DpsA n=1 Tax=Heliomicrobium gestii TaxID=2699 RepID=A0A845LG87_HELGE|nr:dipicolinate synthase subunit DpsA [Heliomicrobium gestii]MBM7868395.1 dipicolinate synthase subunit A [Heliomicrobium gestii]MZP44551.1 dipicolinate synthase subunit DpsA [Heliomicrobium gestii]
MTTLQGIPLVVMGGDARDQILVRRLAERGATVDVIGLPVEETGRVRGMADIPKALAGKAALLLPMPGVDLEGRVYAPLHHQPLRLERDHLALLRPGSPIFVGVARPNLRLLAQSNQLPLVEVAELDELAILNSVPSAEGALQIAMEELPITIHGSRSLVLGFGRLGLTLTRLLQAMGSRVTVVTRDGGHRARAWEMGAIAEPFSALAAVLAETDIIFNTVPAPVLGEGELAATSREALIIDLASAPGGTDFEAARRLGIRALLAPGLPGKVAPKTAGEILARVYPDLIARHVPRRDG